MNFSRLKKGALLLAGVVISIGATAQIKAQRLNVSAQVVNGKDVIARAPISSGTSATAHTSIKKSPQKAYSTNDILIEEDFSKMTSGTPEKPDDALIGNFYGEPGRDIDASFTTDAGWTGTGIHSAGGTVAIISQDDKHAYAAAPLNTPLGDYSGDVTITLRARRVPGYTVGTTLFISACVGGVVYPSMANAVEGSAYFNLGKDWMEIKMTMKNYEARNDGFIQFNVYGAAELDNIKITNAASFIATPVASGVTNFTSDGGFQVNWEPVRKAVDYRFYLYKKVYTSDEETAVFNADFNGSLSEDVVTDGTIAQGEGVDGTDALKLTSGQSVMNDYKCSKIKDANVWLKVVCPEDKVNDLGKVYISNLTSDGIWEDNTVSASQLLSGMQINLDEAFGGLGEWNNCYYGVKVSAGNLPEGAYLLVDNFDFTTGRPGKLEQQKLKNGSYYDRRLSVKDTLVVINDDNVEGGLDSEAEYYYKVHSHYSNLESEGEVCHIFGLAAPKAKVATDIDERGSFTANWEPVAKATSYKVNTYGIYSVAKDDETVSILDEDFSNVNSSVTTVTDPLYPESMNNASETSLDNYTSMPGWTGCSNALAQGYLGCQALSYYLTPYIVTPKLNLSNAGTFDLSIDVVGYPGSALNITVGGVTYTAEYDENGYINGTFRNIPVPQGEQFVNLRFTDSNNMNFMINSVKVEQMLKKGDKVYTYVGCDEVNGNELSVNISGLDKFEYTDFAYNVSAKQLLEGETAISSPSEFILVNLSNGTSTICINTSDINSRGWINDREVMSRYNMAGMKVSTTAKGLNILRMSDGRVVKAIVR